MLMLDTDILIWILRGRESEMSDFEQYSRVYEGIMCITPIQVAEIYAGMKGNEEIETSLLLKKLHTIDINYETGTLAGKYIQKYGKSNAVTLSDSLIAAACKLLGMKLWTYNKKHYPMLVADELV